MSDTVGFDERVEQLAREVAEIQRHIESLSVPVPGTVTPSGKFTEGALPADVEISAPGPTGVAAVDTANVQAALTAAAGGVCKLTKPGVYAINASLERPANCSIQLAPNTILQAVTVIAGPILTDPKATQSVNQYITGGGTIDANNLAQTALFCRNFAHITLGVRCANSTQHTVILGDTTAPTTSFEAILNEDFRIDRTSGAVPIGFYGLWLTNFCTDSECYATILKGQETCVRNDGGNNRFFGGHGYYVGTPHCIFDDNGQGEYVGPACDTMVPSTHAGAAGTAASPTITDAAILPQHQGVPVTGTNIPAGSYVGVAPATTIAEADNGKALSELETLAVASTASWPTTGTGTIQAVTNEGFNSTHTFTYAGIAGNTLTGCIYAGTQTDTVITGAAVTNTLPAGGPFVLVNKTGTPVNPTGIVAGIQLAGLGFNIRKAGIRIIGGLTELNAVHGVDNSCYAATFGPNASTGFVNGHQVAGAVTGFAYAGPNGATLASLGGVLPLKSAPLNTSGGSGNIVTSEGIQTFTFTGVEGASLTGCIFAGSGASIVKTAALITIFYRMAGALTGNLTNITWFGLLQSNCFTFQAQTQIAQQPNQPTLRLIQGASGSANYFAAVKQDGNFADFIDNNGVIWAAVGGFGQPTKTTNVGYKLTVADSVLVSNGANLAHELPSMAAAGSMFPSEGGADVASRIYTIVNIAATACTVTSADGNNVGPAATYVIQPGASATFQPNFAGTAWNITGMSATNIGGQKILEADSGTLEAGKLTTILTSETLQPGIYDIDATMVCSGQLNAVDFTIAVRAGTATISPTNLCATTHSATAGAVGLSLSGRIKVTVAGTITLGVFPSAGVTGVPIVKAATPTGAFADCTQLSWNPVAA